MQEKVIHIPFNREIFIKGQKAVWGLYLKKTLKRNIFYSLLALICLIMGLALEQIGDTTFIIILSGGYLFYMFMFWVGLFERRTKYFTKINHYAQLFEREQMDCTYIFSDAGLEYIDKEKSFKLSWHLFKPVLVFKNYLIFDTEGTTFGFKISQDEVRNDTYEEIYNILVERIPASHPNL